MNGKGENKGVVYCEMQVRENLFFKQTTSYNKHHFLLLTSLYLFRGEKIVKGVSSIVLSWTYSTLHPTIMGLPLQVDTLPKLVVK